MLPAIFLGFGMRRLDQSRLLVLGAATGLSANCLGGSIIFYSLSWTICWTLFRGTAVGFFGPISAFGSDCKN